ncbi:hypothetical protein NCS52_00274700 [Fusarium sp. LHS14.1]|nr:hypothetical protein NCS52_00274700 [Fusarium sp. LHS14.1]
MDCRGCGNLNLMRRAKAHYQTIAHRRWEEEKAEEAEENSPSPPPSPDLRPIVVTVFSAPPAEDLPSFSELEMDLDPPTPKNVSQAVLDKDRVIPDSEEDEDDIL